MALFGGVYLDRKYALLIPILALFLADLFIGLYNPWIMFSVYGSFLVIGLIGLWLKKRKKFPMVIGATLSSSILFFIVTNFSMWAVPNSLYQHNIYGLLSCYEMAIPFFRNTILGDFFYVGAMFGLMELAILISKKERYAIALERITRKRIF